VVSRHLIRESGLDEGYYTLVLFGYRQHGPLDPGPVGYPSERSELRVSGGPYQPATTQRRTPPLFPLHNPRTAITRSFCSLYSIALLYLRR
jgi:hypothetical protein